MHTPDDSPAGHRAVGLRGLRPVPDRLRQLPGPEPFQEVTPVVPVNGGRKRLGAADAGRRHVSLPYSRLSSPDTIVRPGLRDGRADRLRRERTKIISPERARCVPAGPALRSVAASPDGWQKRGKSSPGQPGQSASRPCAALKPGDQTDLHFLLGCPSDLMAVAASGLGYPQAAEELIRTGRQRHSPRAQKARVLDRPFHALWDEMVCVICLSI